MIGNPVEHAMSDARLAIERAESQLADQLEDTTEGSLRSILVFTLEDLHETRRNLERAARRFDGRHHG